MTGRPSAQPCILLFRGSRVSFSLFTTCCHYYGHFQNIVVISDSKASTVKQDENLKYWYLTLLMNATERYKEKSDVFKAAWQL